MDLPQNAKKCFWLFGHFASDWLVTRSSSSLIRNPIWGVAKSSLIFFHRNHQCPSTYFDRLLIMSLFVKRHIVWNSSFLYSNSNKLCNFYFMVFHSALHTYFIIDKYLHTAQVTRSTSQRRRPSRFCHQQNTAAIKLLYKSTYQSIYSGTFHLTFG